MALCSDLLVIAEDARFGYPPARVWGVPTAALCAFRVGDQRAKRLLFTGDLIDGATALEWGLAVEAPPGGRARRALRGARRAHRPDAVQPARDDEAARQPGALCAGAARHSVARGVFDGIARHTPEGYAFQRRASEVGFKEAVRERDAPYDAAP
jgi:enoyl-CoA hydratase